VPIYEIELYIKTFNTHIVFIAVFVQCKKLNFKKGCRNGKIRQLQTSLRTVFRGFT
jgi:hypothetical protein